VFAVVAGAAGAGAAVDVLGSINGVWV